MMLMDLVYLNSSIRMLAIEDFPDAIEETPGETNAPPAGETEATPTETNATPAAEAEATPTESNATPPESGTAARASEKEDAKLGLTLHNNVVTSVEKGSRAEEAGILKGDFIAALNGRPVVTQEDVARNLKNAREAVLIIRRPGRFEPIRVTIKFD